MKICKVFTFEAAHLLPNHNGQCSRPHGHSYRLEVEVEGAVTVEQMSSQGMVVDFADLKNVVNREIINRVDHQDLNAVVPEFPMCTRLEPNEKNVTTAEFLASLFGFTLENEFGSPSLHITRVRVSETSTSWAEWRYTTDYDKQFLALVDGLCGEQMSLPITERDV